MVDKARNNVYIWYSGATDITGTKLAEALKVKHGRNKPTAKGIDLVIGWGAKTKDSVNLGKRKVLNHPDKIRSNRNKLDALALMRNNGVNVAPFSTDHRVADLTFPIIGRTRYHQGGKGFWLCPTKAHAENAANNGAQYFQDLIEIQDEYRLHTVGKDVIYAVKKVQQSTEEMEASFVKNQLKRLKSLAEKNGEKFDEEAITPVLRRQAKKHAQDGPDMLVRSNNKGWKFSRVKTVDKALQKEAVKALNAIGLNFGAVDCCVDTSGKPWILEVNTGPGLEGTSFTTWVEKLDEEIDSIINPKSAMTKVKEKLTGKKKAPTMEKVGGAGGKSNLKDKLALMQDMAEVADAEEAEALERVFKKMFG